MSVSPANQTSQTESSSELVIGYRLVGDSTWNYPEITTANAYLVYTKREGFSRLLFERLFNVLGICEIKTIHGNIYSFDSGSWGKNYSSITSSESFLGIAQSSGQNSALDTQEGGSHYKSMTIQPIEFITKNSIPYLEGNVIKYVSRHAAKNGLEDIKKAIHYLQLIAELQYGTKL